MAAAVADFPGLPNRPAAADQYISSSVEHSQPACYVISISYYKDFQYF